MPRNTQDNNPFPTNATCHCPSLQATVAIDESDKSVSLRGVEEHRHNTRINMWLVPCACNEQADPNGAWIKVLCNRDSGSHERPGPGAIEKLKRSPQNATHRP